MTASTLTPRLAAAVQDDSAGATGVVRQVVDGLLAIAGDRDRLRAAADLLVTRLPWCGAMWQVVSAVHAADPRAALRGLRHRLDLDVQRSVATAVRLLAERGCPVRTAPGSGLVAQILAELPSPTRAGVVGLAGVDGAGPAA